VVRVARLLGGFFDLWANLVRTGKRGHAVPKGRLSAGEPSA
jgi:hypothetical protein